jgi:hypothetical protein
MRKPKNLAAHFWNEERGLTGMLIFIIANNFILSNYLQTNKLASYIIIVLWTVILLTGIVTLVKKRRNRLLLMAVPLLSIIIPFIPAFDTIPALSVAKLILELGIMSILIGMVWMKVFEDGEVTTHRIIGSIVAYLIFGNFFAKIYQYAFWHLPNSIQLPSAEALTDVTPATFIYFSYTTLTTTGFGDILPIHPLVRQAVIMEQLIGVLYPVVLIGRLVSLKK